MPIYLGSTELAATGGSSTATAAAIPKTDIFTSSSTWSVPTSVKDRITNDGYCEIGILIVGGGSTTTDNSASARAGEVVNKIYKLTSNDYDDPNASSPVVTVVVGASGGFSGIINDGLSTQTDSFNNQQLYSAPTFSQPYITFSPTVSYETNASNQILMASGTTTRIYNTPTTNWTITNVNRSYTGFASGVTVADYSTAGFELTFNDQVAFDGVLTVTFTQTRDGYSNRNYTHTYQWSTSNQRWEFSSTANTTYVDGGYLYGRFHYSRGLNVGIEARSGSSTEFAQFQNNPYSPYGINGYAKNAKHNSFSNSVYGSSFYGSPGQGGYVQIFY